MSDSYVHFHHAKESFLRHLKGLLLIKERRHDQRGAVQDAL